MDKFFRNTEIGLMMIFVLLGVTSIIGGIITGKWHCFFIGAMALVLPYVWYVEDYKSKGKSLWQKKNTKN